MMDQRMYETNRQAEAEMIVRSMQEFDDRTTGSGANEHCIICNSAVEHVHDCLFRRADEFIRKYGKTPPVLKVPEVRKTR